MDLMDQRSLIYNQVKAQTHTVNRRKQINVSAVIWSSRTEGLNMDGLRNRPRENLNTACDMWYSICLRDMTNNSSWVKLLLKNVFTLKTSHQRGHRDVFVCLRGWWVEPWASEASHLIGLDSNSATKNRISKETIATRIITFKLLQVQAFETQCLDESTSSLDLSKVFFLSLADLIHPKTNSSISLPFNLPKLCLFLLRHN